MGADRGGVTGLRGFQRLGRAARIGGDDRQRERGFGAHHAGQVGQGQGLGRFDGGLGLIGGEPVDDQEGVDPAAALGADGHAVDVGFGVVRAGQGPQQIGGAQIGEPGAVAVIPLLVGQRGECALGLLAVEGPGQRVRVQEVRLRPGAAGDGRPGQPIRQRQIGQPDRRHVPRGRTGRHRGAGRSPG